MNSTVKIWQTCKTSCFKRFIGSYVTITNALTPAPSRLNEPKLILRLSSSWGYLKVHIVLLNLKGIFTSTYSSAHSRTLGQAEGWRAKQNLYSLLFILLLNQLSDFSISLWTSFLRKIFSLIFFFRFTMHFWNGSKFSHPSPWQSYLSLSPSSWQRLWVEPGHIYTTFNSFPMSTPRFSLELEISFYPELR